MAKDRSVPLTRYFMFVGGVLLALMLVADWYWQDPPPMASPPPIDETILRIRSAHKWPQRVVLDTTAPIDARPSPTAMTETAIPSAPRPAMKALAQANAPQMQTAKRKSSARARYKYPGRGGPVRFAVNPMPSAWPAGW
jgi:hypothetical protein